MVEGRPEVIRLAWQGLEPTAGDITASILTREYAADGSVDELVETVYLNGATKVYTLVSTSGADKVEFYIRFLLKTEFAVLERYLLQVSHV